MIIIRKEKKDYKQILNLLGFVLLFKGLYIKNKSGHNNVFSKNANY